MASGGVAVTARADATATYGCASPGGRDRARRPVRVDGVSEAASQFAVANGRAAGTLTLTAPAPAGVVCPAGEAPQLLRVMYSRVAVLDTTTGASDTINRTFVTTP